MFLLFFTLLVEILAIIYVAEKLMIETPRHKVVINMTGGFVIIGTTVITGWFISGQTPSEDTMLFWTGLVAVNGVVLTFVRIASDIRRSPAR